MPIGTARSGRRNLLIALALGLAFLAISANACTGGTDEQPTSTAPPPSIENVVEEGVELGQEQRNVSATVAACDGVPPSPREIEETRTVNFVGTVGEGQSLEASGEVNLFGAAVGVGAELSRTYQHSYGSEITDRQQTVVQGVANMVTEESVVTRVRFATGRLEFSNGESIPYRVPVGTEISFVTERRSCFPSISIEGAPHADQGAGGAVVVAILVTGGDPLRAIKGAELSLVAPSGAWESNRLTRAFTSTNEWGAAQAVWMTEDTLPAGVYELQVAATFADVTANAAIPVQIGEFEPDLRIPDYLFIEHPDLDLALSDAVASAESDGCEPATYSLRAIDGTWLEYNLSDLERSDLSEFSLAEPIAAPTVRVLEPRVSATALSTATSTATADRSEVVAFSCE